MSPADTQKVMARWSYLGLAHADHRDERLAFASHVLGREVESFTGLTKDEGRVLYRRAQLVLAVQEQEAPEIQSPHVLRTFCLWSMEEDYALSSWGDVEAALTAFRRVMQP